ncbi:entericidin [Rhizobiaceae bacterium n13]|uniref:Entericidin n=1 Tax=Ferirhizobium litorale TaxID=2927786 RepID=A0AAE3U4J0_9HYPH|nr:entericidin [Fererhizobium litorale]MDI7863606.1 entericidin [Fererhizobium litorale]MDI7923473.1 entericidin [Fererhizobium litorale]
MTKTTIARISVVCIALSILGGCANTIKGMGQDAANTVNATESAGQNIAGAAQ